jgi:fructose-bisphosphate aldolase class II
MRERDEYGEDTMLSSIHPVLSASRAGVAIPAFNIPYLPIMQPVVEAIVAQDCFALISVARLEWVKFQAGGLAAIAQEYARWGRPGYTALHLDHVPVIDEDNLSVDYITIIRQAIDLGYQSVMVDGSRLPLAENSAATRRVVEMAHAAGIPCEAELGAIMGHEAGPLPPYEELFASGKGFTDAHEAQQFVRETACDWLSVAIGNVHGAISGAFKDQKKVQARLNLDHLARLSQATHIPLVLHGGSGIEQGDVRRAIKRGIAKINIATDIRQPYEAVMRDGGKTADAQRAVYERTCALVRDWLGLAGTRALVAGSPPRSSGAG